MDAASGEIEQLGQMCYNKAMEQLERTGGLEVKIAKLLNTIQASPSVSSAPGAYIEAHPVEYQELLEFGAYSLRYCFAEFLSGNQTGLQGKLMEELCTEIIGSWGFGHHDILYDTGQDWFDAFRESTGQLAEQYSADEIEKNYPASWILLEMLDKEAQR